jgi:hypothetical protein
MHGATGSGSAARYRQWRQNIGPFIPRPKYVSLEVCDRIDVPVLLAAAPPTTDETARRFAVRVVDGFKVVLKRKDRWPGAAFWFAVCPHCLATREYLLRLPKAPRDAWACRGCLPVTWSSRRYRRRSPSRAVGTPLHRVQVRLARDGRRRERERRRVDRLLAPIVARHGGRATVEAQTRRRNTELALAVIRAVAAHGAVEIDISTVPPPSAEELRKRIRAVRRRVVGLRRLAQRLAAQVVARKDGP